ncbi:hypothetical protein [Bradyrhizobium sp. CB1015]|uniref:hypothetical protein n=1 Tax=Bradyrhizobium sp. CB1015 TaxID=2976822 RepID=UPI0021A97F43|nr:hypothetical protein [Bradyrhizobium sp. CB1015]UWU89773.1 hypothetical protein N2604_25160 [Bradyrhizobium sp. CB1015]
MAEMENKANSVETTDLLNKAIHDAMARIKEVPQTKNLVDSITKEQWLAWDASDEKALVVDSDGLEEHDELDDSLQAA